MMNKLGSLSWNGSLCAQRGILFVHHLPYWIIASFVDTNMEDNGMIPQKRFPNYDESACTKNETPHDTYLASLPRISSPISNVNE